MNWNHLELAGRITRDITLGYTPSQMEVAEFGIAVNKKYKDKKSVLFIDVTAFGKNAVNISKFLSKGDPIFAVGELKLDTWEAVDGSRRSKHKMTLHRFQFLSKAPTGDPQASEVKPVETQPEPAESNEFDDFINNESGPF